MTGPRGGQCTDELCTEALLRQESFFCLFRSVRVDFGSLPAFNQLLEWPTAALAHQIYLLFFFLRERERGHPVVYYQICTIHYVPSIHKIHQTRCNNYNDVILGYMFRP